MCYRSHGSSTDQKSYSPEDEEQEQEEDAEEQQQVGHHFGLHVLLVVWRSIAGLKLDLVCRCDGGIQAGFLHISMNFCKHCTADTGTV